MGQIIIPGYKGGFTNDLFDSLKKQTFQKAQDLDIFTNTVSLKPHLALVTDTTDKTLSTIDLTSAILASDGRLYFKGFGTNGSTCTIWDAGLPGALGTATALTAEATASGTGNLHDIVEFLSDLFYFESTTRIQAFDIGGAAVVTNAVNVSSQAPIFVHEGLKKMFYTVAANQIGATITSTISNTALLTFGEDIKVVQMVQYDRFVVVGIKTGGSKSSKLAIWDGSSTTIESLVDIGDTGLQAIVNVNGSIYCLTASNSEGFGKENIIRIYRWRGGSNVKLLKELNLGSTVNNAATILPRAVAVHRNKLYFGIIGSASGVMAIDSGVWVYDDELDILTLERILDQTTTMTIRGIDIIEGHPMVMWFNGTDFKLNHVVTSGNISSRGIYQSNAFFLNNGKEGTIKRILLNHKPIPTSCGFTVKIKYFGHYPIGGSVLAEDSFTVLTTPQGSGSSTGKTQSTDNATYTIIEDPSQFKKARFVQIQIEWDEVSGITAPEVVFPIIIETVEGADRL